ncbi:MerR family transcriptional regulator [Massilia buxea]|nr:MerR family transcriptional regulator [Pseudoduganella buxea]
MLKVGQLARHTGLTVRTLHHYDSIGLLSPSARSDAGYRLYSRDDVARLQQIQALRQLGMPLADIGTCLASSGISPLTIIDRQLAALDRQIDEAARVRAQLVHMRQQLRDGETPELASWLTTLEHMTMYDKYFSKDELAKLALYQDDAVKNEWRQLVDEVDRQMKSDSAPETPAARELGMRWMTMLERDTGGDPSVMARLNIMHEKEPGLAQSTGITPAIKDFIMRVMGEIKLDAWSRHLTADELAQMRRHQQTRGKEWPPLIEAISREIAADPTAASVDAKLLAGQWMDLFHDMVGHHPDTLPRFRHAIESEPLLRVGRGMTDEMLAWLRQALHRA